MEGMRVGFVERWLDRAVHRWPLAVATDLGKCWRMSCDVSPVQVEKKTVVYRSGSGVRQWAEAYVM